MMEGWKKYRLEEITNVKGGKRLPQSKKLKHEKRINDIKQVSILLILVAAMIIGSIYLL
jgi:hypothetical protein